MSTFVSDLVSLSNMAADVKAGFRRSILFG